MFGIKLRAAGLALLLFFPVLAFAAQTQVDCADYYYGIRRPVDLAKAFQCFQASKQWDMLAVLYLNGQGTSRSIQKAEESLLAWQKADPSQADSLQARALREIIDERKQHPEKSFPPVVFCQDVAMDTVTMNSCAALDDDIATAQMESRLAKIAAKLTPPQAAALKRLATEFEGFKKAEGRRMYQQSLEGTIRGLASFGQRGFVREEFSTLLQGTVENRGLEAADRQAYEVADRELNQTYQEDLRTYTEEHEESLKAAGSKEDKDLYRQYIADYKKASKDAQLRWIRYRDLWAELARQLYPDKKDGFDPVLSMKTAVTRSRIRELHYDPIGPGSEDQ